ncbi:MAG: VOC family protein [Gammaproteobacteria bacterium]
MSFLVNLDVDDLEKAARLYGSAFGLKVGQRFGSFGVEMLGSSAPIYLLVKAPETLVSDITSQRRRGPAGDRDPRVDYRLTA